jgi:hypothetical protein
VLKAFVTSVFVFVVLLGIAGAVVVYRTDDSRVLDQTILDRSMAQNADASAGAATPDAATAGGNGALDAPAPNAAASPNASNGQIDLFRAEARDGMLVWTASTLGAALLCSLAWLAHVWGVGKAASTPEDFHAARPGWLVGLLVFTLATVAAALLELNSLGLGKILAPEPKLTTLLMSFGLGVLGFYTSSALGAPVTMRRSVPLATVLLR